MNILALDTSMGACSTALSCALHGERHLFARSARMARGHAETLMPMVAEVMREGPFDLTGLDLIAATTGPGSFTGVRIAIAAARGLALATGARLWGTDSLTVMARAAKSQGEGQGPQGPFAVAVDARRAMLYFGLFDAHGALLEGPLLIAPADAAVLMPEKVGFAVGNGAALLATAAEAAGRRIEARLPELEPDAAALAVLALEAGESFPTLRPLYLRPPDAKPQKALATF
jgi:tRNA threonylcarbamoyl adenosine modification protein YeaZ